MDVAEHSGAKPQVPPRTTARHWGPPTGRDILVLAGVAVAYYAGARASLELALVGTNVTPLWPPTGIAVVAFFSLGRRTWPAVALAAFLVNAPISGSLLFAGVVAAGNTLAPLVAAWLLERADFDQRLGRRRDAVVIVLCALTSMLISATVGSLALVGSGVIGLDDFWSSWSVWWAGDAMGVLAVAPLLWTAWELHRRPPVVWARVGEAAATLAVLSVVAWLVLHSSMSTLFVILPLVGWTAWRFRQAGAAPAAFIVSTMAAWAAGQKLGPFTAQSLPEMMLTLQAFNASVALSSFYFAAAVTEQRAISDALARARAEALARAHGERKRLEDMFRLAPAGVVLTSGPDHIVEFANPAFLALLGSSPQCVGQPARRAFPGAEGSGYFDLLDRVIATGEALSGDEASLRSQAGEVGNERFFNFVYQPVRDVQGRVSGIFGHEVEVTDMVVVRREVENLASQRAALYDREHYVSETLQRSFLPERLPQVEGTTFAARYVAGSREADVGGDWYDAVSVPDGRVLLVIGDVEGRGVVAAAAMSQLRNALRAYVFEGADPADALRRLNRLVETSEEERFATVLCAVLCPDDGELCYANAGHLPPLLIAGNARTRYLRDALAPPIGTAPEGSIIEARAVLEPGSTVILYTDGLVERHDATIEEGLRSLSDLAMGGPQDVDALVAHVISEMSGDERPDDVAVLGVRREAQPEGVLHLQMPAEPASVTDLRRRLGPFLRRLGFDDDTVRDILLASSEAATNAIEHPQSPTLNEFEVHAQVVDRELRIVVRDFGQWKTPAEPDHRGRGIRLIRALARLEIATGEGGTEATLRLRLPTTE